MRGNVKRNRNETTKEMKHKEAFTTLTVANLSARISTRGTGLLLVVERALVASAAKRMRLDVSFTKASCSFCLEITSY